LRALRESLRNFFSLVKPYTPLFVTLLFAVLCVEAITVFEKYLFKIVIDSGTQYTAQTMALGALYTVLFGVAIAFLIMIVVRSFFKWLHIHLINKIEVRLIADLKRKFFNHIVHLSYNFHTTHKTGSLISRLTRGGRAIESMMDVIVFNFAPMVFELLIAGIAILTISVDAAIVIIITVIAFVLFSVTVQQKQYRTRVVANDTEDIEKGNIGDIFTNIDSVKYFGEERIKQKYWQLSESTKQATRRMWNYYCTLDAGNWLILGLGTFFIIAIPMRAFIEGKMTIGDVVFIYTVFTALMGPMFRFVQGLRSFYQASADFESLYQYDKITNDINDIASASDLEISRGEIEFRKIRFSYKSRVIFNDFSLKINPNEKVAIVGHSGSGKTTIIRLLYRLYDVERGAILVDGKNINEFKQESLREAMSVVPQECVLFDDTIYNNVLFSNPEATKERVFEAIRFAQLDRIIQNFPKKEETIVGERGVRLSGGEKQRVSIARAILADKKVLVLDEATSSLDSHTEAEIQRDLRRLMKGRTSIIIAHRLSTIMHADRIIVLEKGRIAQQGTHKQLIRKKGPYKVLWDLQKGGYIDGKEEDE
jgi:ATP-binding cassette subfamily B protein